MNIKFFTSIVAKQLISRVIAFALVLILLFTLFIGIFTYVHEIKELDQRFDEIRKSYTDVIRAALWVNDRESLKIVLEGICRFPGIEYAHVHSGKDIICQAGEVLSPEKLTRVFPISHVYNEKTYSLGELHIGSDPNFINRKIIRSVLLIALSQSFTITVVCCLVLLLMYRRVIKRLLAITDYASTMSMDSLAKPLSIGPQNNPPDELDHLSTVVDLMRADLHQAFTEQKAVEQQLKEHHQNLENIVAQRTSSLKQANDQLQLEINERKKIENEREKLIENLQKAVAEVKQLSRLLPICASCKKIRDDKGYWNLLESYFEKYSEVSFSHGLCPECSEKFYGKEEWYIKMKKKEDTRDQ